MPNHFRIRPLHKKIIIRDDIRRGLRVRLYKLQLFKCRLCIVLRINLRTKCKDKVGRRCKWGNDRKHHMFLVTSLTVSFFIPLN